MTPPALAFSLTTALAIGGLAAATRFDRGVLAMLLGWTALTGLLAYRGFYLDTAALPPRMLTVILPATLMVIYLYRRVDPNRLRRGWLLAVHLLRIPVELVLYQRFLEGAVPEIMTFEGWNYDILSGLSAGLILVLHWTGRLSPRLLWAWNVGALLLLGWIVGMALLSAPSPLQQLAFSQPNVAVLAFPYTWLPAVVVPVVLLSHLWLFRIARRGRKEAREPREGE